MDFVRRMRHCSRSSRRAQAPDPGPGGHGDDDFVPAPLERRNPLVPGRRGHRSMKETWRRVALGHGGERHEERGSRVWRPYPSDQGAEADDDEDDDAGPSAGGSRRHPEGMTPGGKTMATRKPTPSKPQKAKTTKQSRKSILRNGKGAKTMTDDDDAYGGATLAKKHAKPAREADGDADDEWHHDAVGVRADGSAAHRDDPVYVVRDVAERKRKT